MLTPIDVGVIAGGAIASIFFLLGMREREARRKQFLISTDDPFTGTWREKGGLAEKGRMVITPSGDGLSFQRSMYVEPLVISYGKEFEDESSRT